MQRSRSIDLSGDVGEGAGDDAAFIPLLTSVNVACGGHAGDERSIVAAMETAAKHDIRIGAHPGFADRKHFGRRELPVAADLVYSTVAEQLAYFERLAKQMGVSVSHVKAHGALYHQTARDSVLAEALLRAVATSPCPVAVVGPWQSAVEQATRDAGLRFIREGFSDRSYDPTGQLVPRADPLSLITAPDRVIAQALQMIQTGTVTSLDGTTHPLAADTLCLHGDTPGAIAIANQLRTALQEAGIVVQPP